MTRAELIRKLLETNHLNVPERRQLVPPAIHLSELLAVIRDTVERECRFCSATETLDRLTISCYPSHSRFPTRARPQVAGNSKSLAEIRYPSTSCQVQEKKSSVPSSLNRKFSPQQQCALGGQQMAVRLGCFRSEERRR
jgi:hypothetical protein